MRNVRHVRDLAAIGVPDQYPGVIEQKPRSPIQFDPRLLVGRLARKQSDSQPSSCPTGTAAPQSKWMRRARTFLFGVKRLPRQVDRRFCGGDAGAILLHSELRVAHFDAHLVFELLKT